jgi:two-component system chemotaxis sensor kinase CheA
MDVVKTNIKKLNGLIEIKSEKGQGSEFILRLPLTLAIIQSLLVEVEGEIYSLPLSSVLETLRVDQRQFHVISGQEVLKLRDIVLPLVRLETVFKVQKRDEQEDFCYVVVVGSADKRMGLLYQGLWAAGSCHQISRQLSVQHTRNSRSTILGDGRVALIIDPFGLVDGGE